MKFVFATLLFAFLFFPATTDAQGELVDLSTISEEFDYEIRYATSNNFMKEILYPCGVCLLRPEVARALVEANTYFCEKGYRIKIFDCYRPLDIQKKMWAKVPNPAYVANPYGEGSIHNRGAAVDITLVTMDGCYVEMGSDYDHFGIEAHIDNLNHSSEVLANRNLFIQGMRKHGFKTIRTEWWHFSYKVNSGETLNEPLPCDN